MGLRLGLRPLAALPAALLLAGGLLALGPITPAHAAGADAAADGSGDSVAAGTVVKLGNWRIHHIEELRLGQPTLDPNTGAIYHPVAITGTSISFYVIGAGEQELWEVPIIWAGKQPTGNRFHRLDYFGILEESGSLYIYSRETE
ncbi:hypothetical protein F1188_09545 [Roseospira marina]|uniref:PQQ-binding-like beta-propeller repeat protein n=2 Tax=Roseospira marina TaxID=140057 RepID=A0A5M6IC27_9PROT|nr:hypothetical protein [Roseospira marina]KAA5605844.1 hypothetical protein F1188_09545 [Roseospira marina]